jgi:hypothetical protein
MRQGGTLDCEGERRLTGAARPDLPPEPVGVGGDPGGVDAVHSADGALAGEPVDEGEVVGLTLAPQLVEHGRRAGLADPAPVAAVDHSWYRGLCCQAAAASPRRSSRTRRWCPPARRRCASAPLVDGMERVDEGHRARRRRPASARAQNPWRRSASEVPAARWTSQTALLEVAVVHGPIVPTPRRWLNRVRGGSSHHGTPRWRAPGGGHPILSAGVVPPACFVPFSPRLRAVLEGQLTRTREIGAHRNQVHLGRLAWRVQRADRVPGQ